MWESLGYIGVLAILILAGMFGYRWVKNRKTGG
jgi:hypothetical protein